MPIGILNNIASMAAENQLTLTSSALNTTLEQLSSGSRINSGADDPAGLAIANGLQANISALTQSVSNANNGVGQLQLADGALAQVTNLLNTAVTLATESATGTVSNSQRTAIQAQYASILAEINRIGTATTYNGQAVFQAGTTSNLNAADSLNSSTAAPVTANTVLTLGQTTTVSAGGQSFSYQATTLTTGTNPNEITGSTTGLTNASVLTTGVGTLTLTRGAGGLTSTYTLAAGATMADLISAINTGTSNAGVTAIGGTDVHTNYTATLNAAGALQVTDLGNNNDLTGALTGVTNADQVTTTGQAYTATTNLTGNGAVLTITHNGQTATFTLGTSGATMQQLLTSINSGVAAQTGTTTTGVLSAGAGVAGLSAQIVGGNLVISDTTLQHTITANAETGGTDLNVVTGSVATLTANSALNAGDVFTATRGGQVTTSTRSQRAGRTLVSCLQPSPTAPARATARMELRLVAAVSPLD